LQSADINAFFPTVPVSGVLTYSLAIPLATYLLGLRLYLQAWGPAPGFNQAALIVSNGVDGWWAFDHPTTPGNCRTGEAQPSRSVSGARGAGQSPGVPRRCRGPRRTGPGRQALASSRSAATSASSSAVVVS